MEGAKLQRLELRRPDLRFPLPRDFAARVEGRRIEALSRRAKYLLIDLDDSATIIAHLGMSGSFRIEAGEAAVTPGVFHHERSKDEKHDHVLFHLDGKDGPARVIYNDPRRFGFMDLVERAELDDYPAFRELGPEPVGNRLSADYLATRFADRSQPLKSALLDQKVIAGLGNIYVCEALWRSHLSPTRKVSTLVTKTGKPKQELTLLAESIRAVIADAIEAGGSSLRDHILLPALLPRL
jgi:formamidopyrimidine-DNA glycosylase